MKFLSLMLLLLLLLSIAGASASDINYTASGVYTGQGTVTGWACVIRADQYIDLNNPINGPTRRVRFGCVDPFLRHYEANTSTYSTCPSEATVLWLGWLGSGGNAGPGNPLLRITEVVNGNIACPLGYLRISIDGVSNLWCKQAHVTVDPYPSCGTVYDGIKR